MTITRTPKPEEWETICYRGSTLCKSLSSIALGGCLWKVVVVWDDGTDKGKQIAYDEACDFF